MEDFWSKDDWMPTSPDCNPLDYGVWDHVQDEACPLSHPNEASLISAVEEAWNNMSSEFIIKCCASFPQRLKEVIAARGGHIRRF